MVSIAFKLHALSEKRQELLQTLTALMEKTAVLDDCAGCALEQDPENLNAITLMMEWKSHEAFQAYQQTEHFEVLMGAFNLLCAFKKIQYDNVKK